MKWMKHLYLGDLPRGQEARIRKGIRNRKPLLRAYVLMPAANPRDQLDLMDANVLLQEHFRKQKDLTIVGLASGKEDAVLLAARLMDECVRLTGTPDLRAYLEKRIREEGTEEIL